MKRENHRRLSVADIIKKFLSRKKEPFNNKYGMMEEIYLLPNEDLDELANKLYITKEELLHINNIHKKNGIKANVSIKVPVYVILIKENNYEFLKENEEFLLRFNTSYDGIVMGLWLKVPIEFYNNYLESINVRK